MALLPMTALGSVPSLASASSFIRIVHVRFYSTSLWSKKAMDRGPDAKAGPGGRSLRSRGGGVEDFPNFSILSR
jgi:hypothetical protein